MKQKRFYLMMVGLLILAFGCGHPPDRHANAKEQAMPDKKTELDSKKNQRSMDSIAEAVWIKK